MRHIEWDEYFMGIAKFSALRSKDPNTKVGACIVNTKNRIKGIGYNGFPNGCSDFEYPWENKGDFLNTKYAYVVHAEQNAILNSTGDLLDCIIYVSLFPCNECAKYIIQSGIKEVVYLSDKYDNTDSNIASKKMLTSAGVKFRKLEVDFTDIASKFINI